MIGFIYFKFFYRSMRGKTGLGSNERAVVEKMMMTDNETKLQRID